MIGCLFDRKNINLKEIFILKIRMTPVINPVDFLLFFVYFPFFRSLSRLLPSPVLSFHFLLSSSFSHLLLFVFFFSLSFLFFPLFIIFLFPFFLFAFSLLFFFFSTPFLFPFIFLYPFAFLSFPLYRTQFGQDIYKL